MKIAVLVIALVITLGVIGFNGVNAQANNTVLCGNGVCEAGETETSCPQDCAAPDTGSGKPCSDDTQCPIKEYCESGKCWSRFAPLGTETRKYVAGDVNGDKTCKELAFDCNADGEKCKGIAGTCTTRFDFEGDEVNNEINDCTSYMNLTRFEADDEGSVTINDNLLYAEPDTSCKINGQDLNPPVQYPKDAKPAVSASTAFKRDGSDVLFLYVKDICPAPLATETTRSVRAYFDIVDLVPNPGQVCEAGTAVPKCKGTPDSCGFAECGECKPGFFPVEEKKPLIFCEGPNIMATVEFIYVDLFCPGVYQECTEKPVENPETKDVTELVEFCKYGCSVDAEGSVGWCKPNNNPIITSIFTVPLAKRGETIAINSTGYDPDIVFNDTAGRSKREKIALGCSSVSSETGSDEEFENIEFNPDLCEPISYKFSNPSCQYKIPDGANGNIEFFCRTFDGELWSDEELSTSVYVDATGPKIEILSPAEGSVQQRAFAVNIKDTDETGLASCSFRIVDNGVETKPWTERTCSSSVTVTIGPGKDCPTQGSNSCKIEAKATDAANNTATVSRTFSIRYLFSNVTSPPAGSYQRKDFTASIIDTNLAGTGFSKCEYRIREASGVKLDWKQRNCNSNVKITVGATANCTAQGENVCIVEARAFAQADDATISGEVGLRMFNIDYTSPYSEILSPASGPWISKNFTVGIKDNDPSNLGISKCQYRVLSKKAETVAWTDRECSSGSATSKAKILLGSDCKDEGGDACTVQARAFSISGNEGAIDERNFSIILSNAVLDAFNLPLGVVQTDIGINFSGVPKETINLPTFRVCSSSASVSQCKNAYSATAQNCGKDKPCLCGSLNKYKCEFRCNDMSAGFYYLASGFTSAGQNDFVTNVYTTECPSFNIGLLNEWLARFRYTEQQIFVMKQQTMVLISQTCGQNQTDSEPCTELYYILGKLTDALNLATSHIAFMEETMKDLSVSKASMLIQESERVMALILKILESIDFIPSTLDMSMEIPNTVRLNETVSIPVRITKQGSLNVYAKASCSAAPPSGSAVPKISECYLMENKAINGSANKTFDFEFNATKAGLWNVNCNLVGSFRSDCSLSFPLKSISGSFNAIPPIDSFIQNVTLSAESVENNTNVNIVISVRNPDIDDRFGFVGCKLTMPCAANTTCQQVQSAVSSCERLGADENKSLSITQQMNKVGAWNVVSCFVNVSTRSDCVSSRLHNNTNVNKLITVTAPPISILSVQPPEPQIPFNSNVSALITVQNSGNIDLSVFGTCLYRTPLLIPKTIRSASVAVPSNGQAIINISTKGNETGLWLVIRCAVALTGGSEQEKDSKSLNSNFTVFIKTVCGNNACEINETASNCPADCTTPPTAVCGNTLCEQGETFQTCSNDCPPPNTCASNADTPGTNSRCLCQNSVILPCPTGYSCGDHKCISNEPPPECVADVDCSTGEACMNDKCVISAQCSSDTQCPSGKMCSSGVCVPASQQPPKSGIDSGVILFIIIIIMVILIPIVIFTYLHRAVD